MKTGYPILGLKIALQKALDFIKVIESNGYDSVAGNCSSFHFEKEIDKDRSFFLVVHTQMSGYVRADLIYREANDKKEKYLCCEANELDQKIKDAEKGFLF